MASPLYYAALLSLEYVLKGILAIDSTHASLLGRVLLRWAAQKCT